MDASTMAIAINILAGVETGGQIYGRRRYDAYDGPFANTENEVTCTIGYPQFYGNEARTFCKKVLQKSSEAFRQADNGAGIEDKLTVDWVATRWNPKAWEKDALIRIETTDAGKAVQDEYIAEEITKYESDARSYGVTDIKAILMWVEIQHLGGDAACRRIFGRASRPWTPESIFSSLLIDQTDPPEGSRSPVGCKLFQSRHEHCVAWINQYVKGGNTGMTNDEKRSAAVQAVVSRENRNSYTNDDNLRLEVASGHSDCSSLQQWAYQQIGMEIGDCTGEQIERGSWVTKGGSQPDERYLLPADLIFFRSRNNNDRPYNVGHVEMYIGSGTCMGHGSGIGPVRKNIAAYCAQRNANGMGYIGVKRYIDGTAAAVTPSSDNEAAEIELRKKGQLYLNIDFGLSIVVDGDRGNNTRRAIVMAHQKALNMDHEGESGYIPLDVDGVFGPKTEEYSRRYMLHPGVCSFDVTALECAMYCHAFDVNGIEKPGVFGQGLLNGVHAYQGQSDDYVGPVMWRSLSTT